MFPDPTLNDIVFSSDNQYVKPFSFTDNADEDLGERYIYMFCLLAEFEWFLGLEKLN
jgi:hypothetical protein